MTQPTPICDAYSQKCTTPPEITTTEVQPRVPVLPSTGPSNGDVITTVLVALLLVLIGAFLTVQYRRRGA